MAIQGSCTAKRNVRHKTKKTTGSKLIQFDWRNVIIWIEIKVSFSDYVRPAERCKEGVCVCLGEFRVRKQKLPHYLINFISGIIPYKIEHPVVHLYSRWIIGFSVCTCISEE